MNGYWIEIDGLCRISGDVHMKPNRDYEVLNFKCAIRLSREWITVKVDEPYLTYLQCKLIDDYLYEEAVKSRMDSPFSPQIVRDTHEGKPFHLSPFHKDIFSGKRK